ncbi:MAG: hypothetical protein FWC91_05490 [Defluviitaleaceae bacterium]|nr:hypothetical protein [Defluviitaleaceae bacterium]
MKIFLEKTTAHEALDEVLCNLCGSQIKKNAFGYFEDYLSVTKTWGYGSPADGETHSFDLCYDCYADIVKRFQIPPRILMGMYDKEYAQ